MGRRTRLGVIGISAALGAAVLAVGGYVFAKSSAYDASIARVYDVAPMPIVISTEPAVLARGAHLARSVAGCATRDCHGIDLGGGKPIKMGPVGVFAGPNISQGGLGIAYSDAEYARLLRHGIKKDGSTVRFMPVQDFGWLPDSDVAAIVSWLRTQPAVERENSATSIGVLGKVLDRNDQLVIDVARRIDHDKHEIVPAPEPTAAYGAFLARLCTGCHGEQLSGGRIPGAPSSIPIPSDLTPHETGLKDWTYEDFDTLLTKGVRKNGKALDPFMPIAAFGGFNDTEKHALWARLQTLPPVAFGHR